MSSRLSLVHREPVRVWLGGVLIVVLILLAYGVVTAETAPLWIGLVTALVAVPGVEGLRSQVSPAHPAGN